MYYSKEGARALLPRVGDTLELIPAIAKERGMPEPKAKRCKVVQVHQRNLWYRVEFENGVKECYKVPTPALGHRGGCQHE